VVTLVRTRPEDTVVSLFNLTGHDSAGALPSAGHRPADIGASPRWRKLLDPRAAEKKPADPVNLGPWEFAVYLRSPQGDDEKGVAR